MQKILSARGICSRRKAEEYLLQGLVKVNGKTAVLGQKADPATDWIIVAGKVVQDRREMLYYVMNKPVGVETTNVPRSAFRVPRSDTAKPRSAVQVSTRNFQRATRNNATVRDLLPENLQGKIFPIGRLDKDSSGLLLFTNDGVLAYRLTHPKFNHDKEYDVIFDRPVSPMVCRNIEEGFEMDGSRTKPLKVKKIAPTRVRIVLTEGKNRQIRRMCQHFGYTVKSLRRIRILTLNDERLKPGAIRALLEAEKVALLHAVGL
ncbi:MAG: pseudouridine synthase [Desulfobaccales bacterium]